MVVVVMRLFKKIGAGTNLICEPLFPKPCLDSFFTEDFKIRQRRQIVRPVLVPSCSSVQHVTALQTFAVQEGEVVTLYQLYS